MIIKLTKLSIWLIVVGLTIAVIGSSMALVMFILNGMTK